MRPITMVDLKSQYRQIKSDIDIAIQDVIDNTAFINGPAVNTFTGNLANYLNVKHVIPTANGTDALQVALMSLGLKRGDEVITTDFTFVATVEVIALLGLKPVLVDVDPFTFNMNVNDIASKITKRTKAIIPVHIFGQAALMEGIMEIAEQYHLAVIEDTAQAIGSDYYFDNGTTAKLGTIGTMGCTSFFPSKNLGCYGDGGAVFTNDDDLAEKLRSIVNHGMTIRYYHDYVGINSRLDSIQAAILNVKLQHLDEYNQKRRATAEFYTKAFGNNEYITPPIESQKSRHIFHQYTLKIKGVDRNELQKHLQKKGIPSAIYYPVPLHLQKAYIGYGYRQGDFPVTEALCNIVLSLPMHTELDHDQLNYITESVLEFVNQLV